MAWLAPMVAAGRGEAAGIPFAIGRRDEGATLFRLGEPAAVVCGVCWREDRAPATWGKLLAVVDIRGVRVPPAERPPVPWLAALLLAALPPEALERLGDIARCLALVPDRAGDRTVTERGPDADKTGAWLRPDEAASRLGTTVEAVRSRIRRGALQSKRGNDGRIRVLVPATEPDQAGPDSDRAPTDREDAADWLRTERNEALLEADHWRSVAETERTGRVRAEAELDAARTMLGHERRPGRTGSRRRWPRRGGRGWRRCSRG